MSSPKVETQLPQLTYLSESLSQTLIEPQEETNFLSKRHLLSQTN